MPMRTAVSAGMLVTALFFAGCRPVQITDIACHDDFQCPREPRRTSAAPRSTAPSRLRPTAVKWTRASTPAWIRAWTAVPTWMPAPMPAMTPGPTRVSMVVPTQAMTPGPDAGIDGGSDAGDDAGADAGNDAGLDAGVDAGVDAGIDAGPPPFVPPPNTIDGGITLHRVFRGATRIPAVFPRSRSPEGWARPSVMSRLRRSTPLMRRSLD